MGERFTLRGVDRETGDVAEVELSDAQALDLAAGEVVTYWRRKPDPFVTEDGQLGERESAVPEPPEAA